MITDMVSISSVSAMKSAIGKCKESVASKLNSNWQEQVWTHVRDPMDWKLEETIFPGQKASVVISCYTDLEEQQKVQKRTDNDSVFILLKLLGHNGEIIFVILDSGSSELVVTDRVTKDNVLLHRQLGLQQIEVVSTQTTVRPCYTIGIPIIDPKYAHQEMRGLSMETIISDLPELDLSEEVDICYQEYVRQCKKNNKLIKYPRSLWPDGKYCGSEQSVSFLLGIRGMEMDITLYQYRYSKNLQTLKRVGGGT